MKQFRFVAFFFFIFFFLRFWPLLTGKTIIFGDTFSYFVPGKIFTASVLRGGHLPLWNPYLLGGISWIGDLNQSLFSLSTLFFTFFEPVQALHLTVFIHLGIGFFGTYWLGKYYTKRRFGGLTAAVSWMFSGIVSATLGNPSVLQSIAWLPWIVIASILPDRRKGFVIGLIALCISVFGGYPQILPYGIAFAGSLGLFMLHKRGIFSLKEIVRFVCWWSGLLVLTLALTSFLTIPFFHTLQQSTRMIQTTEQASEGSLHPIDLLSIVFPNIFIHEREGIKWGPQWNEMSHSVLFVPWIVVCITFEHWREKKISSFILFLLICSFCAGIIALGRFVPLISFLLSSLPILRFARGPSHALSIVTLTIPLLCAIVLSNQSVVPAVQKRKKICIAGGILFLLLSSFFVLWQFPRLWSLADTAVSGKLSRSQFHTVEKDYLISKNIVGILLFNLVLTCGLYMLYTKKRLFLFLLLFAWQYHEATANALFFAPNDVYPSWRKIQEKREKYHTIVGDDLVFFTNGNAAYTDFVAYMDALTVRAPFSDSYIKEDELARFTQLRSMGETLTPNWNMVYGVRSMNGYVSLFPQQISDHFEQRDKGPLLNSLPSIATTSSLLREWNVSYVVVDPWFPGAAIFDEKEKVTEFGRAAVYRLTGE